MPYHLKITRIINIMGIFKLERRTKSLNACSIQDRPIFGSLAKNVKTAITQITDITVTHAKREVVAN
jgi:hypothetical protein